MAREKNRFQVEMKQKLHEFRWQQLTMWEIIDYLDEYYKKKYISLHHEFVKRKKSDK